MMQPTRSFGIKICWVCEPGATVDVDVPADAEGPWAFHCHQLYHMETGMMRKIEVVRETASAAK